MLIYVKNGLKNTILMAHFSKFSWGSMPPDPPRVWCASHTINTTLRIFSGENPVATSSFVSSVGGSSSIASQIDIPDEPNHPKQLYI